MLVFYVPLCFPDPQQKILIDWIAFMHNQLSVRLVIFSVKLIIRTSSFKYLTFLLATSLILKGI